MVATKSPRSELSQDSSSKKPAAGKVARKVSVKKPAKTRARKKKLVQNVGGFNERETRSRVSLPSLQQGLNQQRGFFDERERLQKLSNQSDPLEKLNAVIDWEIIWSVIHRYAVAFANAHEVVNGGTGG
jgi:hypothetical protein